uniref:Uncharacterized protein n=1 Tax=Rhizophora mucronata TaxID=61149 RepID=A0A2P2JRD2_RHIMU
MNKYIFVENTAICIYVCVLLSLFLIWVSFRSLFLSFMFSGCFDLVGTFNFRSSSFLHNLSCKGQ